MQQREVQDSKNVRWSCVEALAAVSEGLTSDKNGNVTVVCTPSGGEQTVRVKLESDWFEKATDEEILKAIQENRG